MDIYNAKNTRKRVSSAFFSCVYIFIIVYWHIDHGMCMLLNALMRNVLFLSLLSLSLLSLRSNNALLLLGFFFSIVLFYPTMQSISEGDKLIVYWSRTNITFDSESILDKMNTTGNQIDMILVNANKIFLMGRIV
jgi:hypothetical protein